MAKKIIDSLKSILKELKFEEPCDFDKIATKLLKIKNPDLSDIFIDAPSDIVRIDQMKVFGFCKCHLLPVVYKIDMVFDQYKKCVKVDRIKDIVQSITIKPAYQEQLTKELANSLLKILDAKNVKVKVIGYHFCMEQKMITAESVHNEEYEAMDLKENLEKKKKGITEMLDELFSKKQPD